MWIFIFLLLFILLITVILWVKKNFLFSKINDPLNPKEIKKRKKYLDTILILANKQHQIDLNDVKKILNISEEEASQYLNYLVNLGKIAMSGDRGQKVNFRISENHKKSEKF